MASISYEAKAPGSLMLFGEHAVLKNKYAIVAAVNHYIRVQLVPRIDRQIYIVSSLAKKHRVLLDKLKIIKPYEYVLTAISFYQKKIKTGFTLYIDSDFPANIGFGSSSAVTVATLSVLDRWLSNTSLSPEKLYRKALKVVRQVQGVGSGADVAASVFGGVILYKAQPLVIKKISSSLPLVAIYSGEKVPTVKVVAQVQQSYAKFRPIFDELYKALDLCSCEAAGAIKSGNWIRLGKLMNIHQGLQEALGTSNEILAELIFALRGSPTIYGAKISGSGLGDCVIGLGGLSKVIFPATRLQEKKGVRQINVAVSRTGIFSR